MISNPLPDIFVSRVHDLAVREPDLIAEVRFYPTSESGRKSPVPNGYGCPCILNPELPEGNDARFLFANDWVELGETVTAKLCFMLGHEVAGKYIQARRFYLWEGKVIGEATVV